MDIDGAGASVVPVAAVFTGVAGRDPASPEFVNLVLAAARLGMGGGAPVPGAGEFVRDGGPPCNGVPGRESGRAIRSGSVADCRLCPDARAGMGGAARLVVGAVVGGAGEGPGEGTAWLRGWGII